MKCYVFFAIRFNTAYAAIPEIIITRKSIGANGQAKTGSNKNPLPYLKRTPPIKINSPIYITVVNKAAEMLGKMSEYKFFLP